MASEPEGIEDVHCLDSRIRADDIAGLIDDIVSAPVSGKPFVRLLHSTIDQRIYRAEGRIPSSELVGDNGVAIWFSDVTHWQIERDSLRSEEHTSELQSLMRISYAVFCLKKKKKNQNKQQTNQI